jgi:hypothetical protein
MNPESKFADTFKRMLARQKAATKPVERPIKPRAGKPVRPALTIQQQERIRVRDIRKLPNAEANRELTDFLIESDIDVENAREILEARVMKGNPDEDNGPTDADIEADEIEAQIEVWEWACLNCGADVRGDCECPDDDLSNDERKIRGRG